MTRAEDILDFWFGDGATGGFREAWFGRDEAFDREIRDRFAGDYEKAAAGELDDWKDTPRGCLALILLLDQFPRNMFRGDPRAFATDARARQVARHTVETGLDRELEPAGRMFVYLPFEHSEDREDQRRSVELFEALDAEFGMPGILGYAVRHREIVERFGRFPHRNEVLGRASTPGEVEFLKEPGSSF